MCREKGKDRNISTATVHDDAETIADYAKNYRDVKVICAEPEQMLLRLHLEKKLKEYYQVAESYVNEVIDPK